MMAWPRSLGLALCFVILPVPGWAQSFTRPELVVQASHSDRIRRVAFSANGQLLASASDDYTVRLLEVSTGFLVRILAAPPIVTFDLPDHIYNIAFSPDSHWLALSSGGGVALWEVATGRRIFTKQPKYSETFSDVAFSPDSRSLAVAAKGEVKLLDVSTGTELRTFTTCFGPPKAYPVSTGNEPPGQCNESDNETSIQFISVMFSPGDGRWLAAAENGGLVRLWDTGTGRQTRPLPSDCHKCRALVFSPDGRRLTSAGWTNHDLYVTAWELATGSRLVRFRLEMHRDYFTAIAVSSDGIWLSAAGGERDKDQWPIKVWNVETGQNLRTLTVQGTQCYSLAISPDGGSLACGEDRGVVRLWDLKSESRPRALGPVSGIACIAFSPPDGHLLASAGKDVKLWDLTTGNQVRTLAEPAASIAFSPDGRLLAAGGDRHLRVNDVATGRELLALAGEIEHTNGLAFSPKERWLAYLSPSPRTFAEPGARSVTLREISTGREQHISANQTEDLLGIAFSPDEDLLAVASRHYVKLWDLLAGRELKTLTSLVNAYETIAFGAGGRWLVSGSYLGPVTVWDLMSGGEPRILGGHVTVNAVAFSPNGRWLASASSDHSVTLWEVSTWREVSTLRGHMGSVRAVAFSPDGRWLASGGDDGTTRVWDFKSEQEVARLVSFTDGTWVVATPDGRFDTNNLEEIKALHWIMPDDPLHALPLEIFMRDYYEPRLLPKILTGEKLPPIRSLAELNRAQPKVEISGVERERDAQGRPGDTVTVRVTVSGASKEFGLAGQQRRMETGAYDLRLFRDGQLVGQWPPSGSQASPVGVSATDELHQWRQERLMVKLKEGKRQIVFKGIRLPRRKALKEVQFSAYAFNEDRVKSETARKSFTLPTELTPRTPRAYIISVGVNAFEDDRWDLTYAANDATQLGTVLTTRLQALRDEQGQPRYEQVVWVKLTAEGYVDHEGKRHLTKVQASKAQIKAVLKTLAGQPVKADTLKGIDHTEKLRRANPEDLVILTLSTHGEVDQRGRFYLLPHDIGLNPTEPERRTRAISNDELSEWLQGLDAIDVVMIVDACHSAASVESTEFKPGPMGSRGLGQLAYDKGIRILAATQIDQYALETQKTQLGLLSYALVREGLEQNRADYKPQDQQIWLSEWLSYASERVAGLYQDWKEGRLKGRKKGEFLDAPEAHPGDSPSLQQPALFDFARKRDALIGAGSR